MASRPKKKKTLDEIRNKLGAKMEHKPLEHYSFGKSFRQATGILGAPKGMSTMLLGHSNTGKTTALLECAKSVQEAGDLAVFIITENKFSAEHASIMGINMDEAIISNNFRYIEEIFDFMKDMLDMQEAGEIDQNICFLWDSVGTIACKMNYDKDGGGGNQHTARVISEKFGMGLSHRISFSRNLGEPFTNTLVFVNQGYNGQEDMLSPPKLEPKGGKSMYQHAAAVYRFGGHKSAGSKALNFTYKGRKVKYGLQTKVTVDKNHLTGADFNDGKIVSTAHGFVLPEDAKEYYTEHMSYYKNKLAEAYGIEPEEISTDDIGITVEDIQG